MARSNLPDLVRRYLDSLAAGFHMGVAPDGTAVLSTPFRFLTGDPVEIAVWEDSGDIVLSDRGGLVKAFLRSGIDALESDSYRNCIQGALGAWGADLEGSSIIRPAAGAAAGSAVQALIQGVMDAQAAGQGAHRRTEPEPETQTYAVVREILEEGDARYRENTHVTGALGRTYPVDFQLAFRTSAIIRAVLVVAQDRTLEFAERWNFRFRDIRAARPRLQRLVVVDDDATWSIDAHRTIAAECERVFRPRETEQLGDYLRGVRPAA